jgi:hypothetical protein
MIGLKKWLKCLFEELWMRAKKEKKGWSRTLQVLLQRYYYIHSLTAMELSPTTQASATHRVWRIGFGCC